jgi:hypothetical protein
MIETPSASLDGVFGDGPWVELFSPNLAGLFGDGPRIKLSTLIVDPCNSDWGISPIDSLTPTPNSLLGDDDDVQ